MNRDIEVMSQKRLDHYIDEAARVSDYVKGFGVRGCDLNHGQYWAVTNRQSIREQAENDRLGEYLIACSRLAKQECVTVPHEYIFYDTDSSEDFNRPGMIQLRQLIR